LPSFDWPTVAARHYSHVVFRAVENRVAMVKADVAFDSGLIVIALSLALLPFKDTRWHGAAFLILRDLVMVFGFGFAVPLYYTLFVEKNPLSELGLTGRRWALNLAVNAVLTVLLALQLTAETPAGPGLSLTPATLGAVFYIILTSCVA